MKAKTKIKAGGLSGTNENQALVRVLAVDDEADVRELIQDELDGTCKVDTASSFDEARSRLAKNEYDVVLIDIMGVKGFDLLQKYSGKARCIVLTAHSLSPESFRKARDLGARLFLSKEDMGKLNEYIARVVKAEKELWTWLAKKAGVRRWFGDMPADELLGKGKRVHN
jgi:two-component system, OmpR family, response regulator CpxR